MPVVPFIPAIIGGVSSIAGGLIGSHAANKAANTQATAAQGVSDLIGLARNDVTNIGGNVQQATLDAGNDVVNGQQNAAGAVNQATGSGNDLLAQMFGLQSGALSGLYGQQTANLGSLFGQQNANLAPYLQSGQQGSASLQDLITKLYAPGGQMSQQFAAPTEAEAEQTPGYQFTINQGLKALKRSAAAGGGLNSGDTLKAITQYAQGLAGTTYNDVYNRSLNTFQTNRNNALNSISPLLNIQGQGQQAAGMANQVAQNYGGAFNQASQNFGNAFSQASQNFGNQAASNLIQGGYYSGNSLIDALKYQGNARIQGNLSRLQGAEANLGAAEAQGQALQGGAAAQAAGTVGSANAWNNALGGVANAGQQAVYTGIGRGWGGGSAAPSLSTIQNLPSQQTNPLMYIPYPQPQQQAPQQLPGNVLSQIGYLGQYGGYGG